jgi:3-dehydroquinate synthase
MKAKINVRLAATKKSAYPIYISQDLLSQPQQWLGKSLPISKIVIIGDNHTYKLYVAKLAKKLTALNSYKIIPCRIPAGEKNKNHATKQKIENQLFKQHCARDTLLLAVGGGVVGDLVGYVAATYMRGIPYVQIPTTLLAMVDSSIGGKTGIDTSFGKNLIGAYWQPQAVISDLECLQTLTTPQMINGLIEAIKVFLIQDASTLYFCKKHLTAILNKDIKVLKKVISKAAAIKARVISQDTRETNLRQILNFGHTIGHALESLSQYKLLHGYAVAYGMLFEIKIARLMHFIDEKEETFIQQLFLQLGFKPGYLKRFAINDIIRLTKRDKKVRADKVHYVLLQRIGQVVRKNGKIGQVVPESIVRKAYAQLLKD